MALSNSSAFEMKNSDEIIRDWLPLLILPFIWLCFGLWYHASIWHSNSLGSTPKFIWIPLSLGSGTYLFVIALFSNSTKNNCARISNRIAVALFFGIAAAFISFAISNFVFTGSKTDGGDVLSPLNALAAVLSVVLTIVSFIAQKSAAEAKSEAEKARQDMLTIQQESTALTAVNHLLSLSFAAKNVSEEYLQRADEIFESDPSDADHLNLIAEALAPLSDRLREYHQLLLMVHLGSFEAFAGQVVVLTRELDNLEPVPNKLLAPLRSRFFHPLVSLLDELHSRLDSQQHLLTRERDDIVRALRQLRQTLVKV